MLKSLSLGLLLIISAVGVSILGQPVHTYAQKCDLPGENHSDWNPSSRQFLKVAYSADSLCDIAVCVDKGDCANHTKLDWNRFIKSPAFLGATEEQQEDLINYHKHGSGADGMVGYEILDIVQESNHHRR